MKVKKTIEGGIVVFTVTGVATVAGLVAAIEGHFSQTPSRHALWDLTGASLSSISSDLFSRMIEASDRYADARGPGASSAVVVKDARDALLVKAFGAHGQIFGRIRFAVFQDRQNARQWLLSADDGDGTGPVTPR